MTIAALPPSELVGIEAVWAAEDLAEAAPDPLLAETAEGDRHLKNPLEMNLPTSVTIRQLLVALHHRLHRPLIPLNPRRTLHHHLSSLEDLLLPEIHRPPVTNL